MDRITKSFTVTVTASPSNDEEFPEADDIERCLQDWITQYSFMKMESPVHITVNMISSIVWRSDSNA